MKGPRAQVPPTREPRWVHGRARPSLACPPGVALSLSLGLAACAGQGAEPATHIASHPDTPSTDAAIDYGVAPAACAPLPPIDGFVERHGSALSVDGRPFRVGGTNLYFLQQLFAEAALPDRMADALARDALDTMVCMRLAVARIWAFNDLPADSPSSMRSSPGVFHEQGLRGLDRAVAEAKARGVRLILTLTNNWEEYGGLPTYARWSGREKDDFFREPALREHWKAWVRFLAARTNVVTGVRYRDEPAIVAWELGNELRCPSCVGTTRFIDTMEEMAGFARAAFPRQLIADGGEGFDDAPELYPGLSDTYAVAGSAGPSYHRLARILALDMLSYHFYPRSWGLDPGYDAPIWIRRHEEIARQAGKAAYMGEYGLGGGEDGTGDDVRAPRYDQWLAQLFSSTGGLMGLFWQLVPPGRPNRDGHGIRYLHDARTVAVMRKWADIAR
jgi:mannan endo-1,4-beta-mannosidase